MLWGPTMKLMSRCIVMVSSPDTLEQGSIVRIQRQILRWGRSHYQSFEWRTERDPWLTLVAEFFLQRTRARQVEAVFRDFRNRYPTANTLVQAGPDAASEIMSRLGLRWRAPFLYGMARAVDANGGTPPDSLRELRGITGVGLYTSAAWLSLHRGKRAVVVDSNIARWLSRLTGRPYPPDTRHVPWIKELAERLTPKRAYRDYNYAVLDFTMMVCTTRSPRCNECPVARHCAYGQTILGQLPQGELQTPDDLGCASAKPA